MMRNLKRMAEDTLTREMIEEDVKEFSHKYCNGGTVYDIGGVQRYSYRKYFSEYKTINFDKAERPDILASAERMPFKDGSVDNFLCLAMLEHTREPEATIREMYRTMKKGGRALIWVPFYWREHNYPIDNCRYTSQGIISLLEKHGFRIIESSTDRYSGLFFILSHNVRFMMKDPHRIRTYDPLLCIHAALYKLGGLDSALNLRHPNLYTGVSVVAEKR